MEQTTEQHVRQERERARELRKSRWWQTAIAKATCYYCRAPMSVEEVTMDHVVPIAQGGRSTPGNIVTACKQCNNDKRDMTAVEWALRLAEIGGD